MKSLDEVRKGYRREINNKGILKKNAELSPKLKCSLSQVGTTLKVSAKAQNKDFASAELCKAMFDIYVGYSPSPSTRIFLDLGVT